MTSLTYQAAMEVNPALREQFGRQIREALSETQNVSFLERLLRFWDSLYVTPMPTPRHYL